jgi:Na+-driven multidrug efflux pump
MLPAFGIALAAMTLVGNALGRGDAEDAAAWGWDCAALTVVYGVLLSLLLIPLANPILAVFLTNPETRELAYLPMVLWAILISFDTAGMVLMNALIGAGDTRSAMWISVLWQWLFFLPLAWLAGPVLGFGLLGVWIVNGVYRTGQAMNSAAKWAGRRWASIQI